jgi:hypothetical protein
LQVGDRQRADRLLHRFEEMPDVATVGLDGQRAAAVQPQLEEALIGLGLADPRRRDREVSCGLRPVFENACRTRQNACYATVARRCYCHARCPQ